MSPLGGHEHREPFESFVVADVGLGSAIVDAEDGDFVPRVRLLLKGRWNRGFDSTLEVFLTIAQGAELVQQIPEASIRVMDNYAEWEAAGRPTPPEGER